MFRPFVSLCSDDFWKKDKKKEKKDNRILIFNLEIIKIWTGQKTLCEITENDYTTNAHFYTKVAFAVEDISLYPPHKKVQN